MQTGTRHPPIPPQVKFRSVSAISVCFGRITFLGFFFFVSLLSFFSAQGQSFMGTKGGHGPCQLSKRNPIVGRSVCVVQERERQQRSALSHLLTCPFPSPEAVNWTSSSSLLLTGVHLLLLISSSSSSYFFPFFFRFTKPINSTFCLPKFYLLSFPSYTQLFF
jgi:hypothetical protein